jgi:hypothetical protein
VTLKITLAQKPRIIPFLAALLILQTKAINKIKMPNTKPSKNPQKKSVAVPSATSV